MIPAYILDFGHRGLTVKRLAKTNPKGLVFLFSRVDTVV